MGMLDKYLSLSPKNQFSFKCPVFEADTKMSACMRLRDIVVAGHSPAVRKGCQAAVRCGQCPAAALVSLYSFNRNWENDFHGSSTPKQGRLHATVLERVSRVMPLEPVMTQLQLSDIEKEKLRTARFRIQDELKTAPGEAPQRASDFDSPPRRRAKPAAAPKPVTNRTTEAAKTGDLAAAINA